MKLVLGARGRLGRALCAEFGDAELLMPDRQIYERWWHPDAVDDITRFLDEQHSPIDTIFVAAGIIDPTSPALAHDRVNHLLPRQVIRGAVRRGIRVITFGTILETISATIPSGGYIASKVALARFVQEHAQENGNALHLRIHTLYGGGAPDPFMFTGQMLAALQKREAFPMSPGTQLREYHHIDDEAPAVATLSQTDLRGIIDLNHGNAIRLAELAQSTFKAFNASDLLMIGALPAPANERIGVGFERAPALRHHRFRDVRTGMVDYLRSYLPDSAPYR